MPVLASNTSGKIHWNSSFLCEPNTCCVVNFELYLVVYVCTLNKKKNFCKVLSASCI